MSSGDRAIRQRVATFTLSFHQGTLCVVPVLHNEFELRLSDIILLFRKIYIITYLLKFSLSGSSWRGQVLYQASLRLILNMNTFDDRPLVTVNTISVSTYLL